MGSSMELETHGIQIRFDTLQKKSMASKIPQLQSKVAQASQVAANRGGSYYKLLMEQNKHYIQDPPTIEKCQSLAKQLFYTRLASIPHRYDSFYKELECAKNMLKNRQNINIENAGLVALFGLECYAWFCGGEIVGRGFTVTGYYV
ncbi:hypothetical protein RIF29_28053 [Crotalaria pallida]|uniref:Uncharacterized protein n=1 Tax=Crotalaria pallida TaxID=3830 RepID=A0AAN9EQ84_CROPI